MPIKLIALLLNAFLLIGCADQYDNRMSYLNDKDKLEKRQNELQKANFDLSKVSVARFTVDGEKHEVTSLMPVKLSAFKESITLLAFNDKQDQVILFTHDAVSGKGYEIPLLINEFETKKTIKFPVVNADDGRVVDRIFVLNTLIIR